MSEAKRPPDAPTETAILPLRPALPSGGAPEGAFLGAYRVESLLGKGGMGEVFLAWDDRLKRRVAIKRIRPDSSRVSRLPERFLQEAQAAAGLNHPAIVQVYDLVEDAAGLAIVMEHVEGRTLAEHLDDGPLALPLVLRLAREIAGGLAAAHAAGIVHRDLKAGNVIVTPAGHAKILDFGLARRVSTPPDEALTQDGAVLGTYHAMSPEQASGREVDARSDLFSFGTLTYEMLTGRSPFRGKNALETLKRLATEDPPPVSTIRPEVPARLSDLIERLLEKDPDDRPGSAAEVAAALATIETGILDHRPPVPPHPRPRGVTLAAVLATVLAMSGTAWVLLHRPAETLRVLVQEPEVKGDDPRLALAASGVLAASLNTLTSLEGIAPLEPRQLAGTEETAGEAARALAADEVLVATVEGAGNLGRVTLRRVAGSEGRVLWTDAFDVSVEARDLRFLADAVGSRLSRGYPDREPREESLELGARDEDYTAFLEIKQRLDAGKAQPEAELPRLEEILRTSPRFLQGWIIAADVSHILFTSTREISYRDRALAYVRQAQALAPGDPRPLQARFKIALAGDRPEIARETLAQLEELLPGDPQLPRFRAELAQRLGRTDQALAGWRAAVELAPTWRNLYGLAALEAETGRIADARRHFEQLLEISPGNLWGLEKLAELELFYGDLARAERLYLEYIAKAPSQRTFFTNLGIVRSLLGNHEGAIEAYEQALLIDPDHVYATLNLADSRLALGQTGEALALYRKILRLLEENRPPGGPSLDDSLVRAQCLAHLGRTREAVEIARRSLAQRPDDPDILYSAAVVHALAGDLPATRAAVRKAIENGMQPRFFDLAAFAPLRQDPELRDLLARPAR